MNAAHVFWTRTAAAGDQRVTAPLLGLLDEAERARYTAFHFDRDRWIYLVAHALTRIALSSREPVAPREWAFETGEFGRPEVAPSFGVRTRFNLSHTRGLVACIVCSAVDCGVDVEQIASIEDAAPIARRMFSSAEVSELMQREGRAFDVRFTQYWSLKEAYIKALGLGLQLDTKTFTLELDALGGPRLCSSTGAPDPEAWQLGLGEPTSEHVLAWALRGGPQGVQPGVSEVELSRLVEAAAGVVTPIAALAPKS